MTKFTKICLNLLQRSKLDDFILKITNNKIFNPLILRYCWQRRKYLSFCNQHAVWSGHLKKAGVDLNDKKILEIGSGSSLGLAYFFLADNYQSWLGSDYYCDLRESKKSIAREIGLINEVARNINQDILKDIEIKDNDIIFSQRLGFMKLQVGEMKQELIDKFDVIVSRDVLEHLAADSLEPAICNLSFYLKTGGIMIHEIDFKDHVNPANPFNFYKYSKERWDRLTGGTIFYTNRLRLADYLRLFNKYHLQVKYLDTEEKQLGEKNVIDKFFAPYAKKDLETTNCFVILKKV